STATLAKASSGIDLSRPDIGTLFWFPVGIIFRSVQVFRNSQILHRHAEAGTFVRPNISAKVSSVILSQLSEISRRENNRVCATSVKRWLADARRIFPRSVEQQAQRRNLNMRLVAKGNNPVRQR